MELRVFPVVGAALNFGLRRMETIMRVAWLPVVLLLVFNMASAFAILSIANDRFVTFADLAQGVSYNRVVMASQAALAKGLIAMSGPIWIVYALTTAIDMILVASFMAPLVRLSGLGEHPSPGIMKLAFGPDQLRYILASIVGFLATVVFVYGPVGAAAYWVIKYIVEALSQTYVSFPNPESLHTIELVSAADVLEKRGSLWYYLHGVPLMVAAGFAVAFWLFLNIHFHPKNRGEGAGAPNLIGRAFVTLLVMGAIAGLVWLLIHKADEQIGASIAALISIGVVIAGYISLRVFPYGGVAVCRKSMGVGGMFHVTRGWNIFRMLGIVVLVAAFLFAVQFAVNVYLFWFLGATVNTLYAATLTATKLAHSGEAAPWVLPVFVWVWNGLKILVNIFLVFFNYGVAAGLQGRLYRESERAEY